MGKTKVSIVKIEEDRVQDAVSRALDQIGGIGKFLKPGQSVMLKPNYTGNLPQDSGGVTSNRVMEAVLKILRQAKAGRIGIVEGCGTIALGTMRICENLGIDRIARQYGAELIDANLTEMCTKKSEAFRELQQVTFTKLVYDFDLIINIPVMKTHPLVDVTVAMKNMNGLLQPEEKRHFHDVNLRRAIVDFHQVLPPYLTIVDGITGMEGMGPAEGMPVPMGIILAGENPVALDAVAARIMGFDPEQIRYLQYAEKSGIGPIRESEIEVCGNQIHQVYRPFAPAEPGKLEFDGVEILELPSAWKCVGCRAVAAIALNRIRAAGQLPAFEGMKILLHDIPKEEIELKEGEHLFCIGNCTAAYREKMGFHDKERPIHEIQGCAPAGLTVEEAIRKVYGVPRLQVEVTAAGRIPTVEFQ